VQLAYLLKNPGAVGSKEYGVSSFSLLPTPYSILLYVPSPELLRRFQLALITLALWVDNY
jgi:hypothetical protein